MTAKETKLEYMSFSVRTYNCLRRAGKNTLDDLVNMCLKDYYKVRNLGKHSLDEVINKLKEYGYELQDERFVNVNKTEPKKLETVCPICQTVNKPMRIEVDYLGRYNDVGDWVNSREIGACNVECHCSNCETHYTAEVGLNIVADFANGAVL